MVFIGADKCRKLQFHKEHFGMENFANIFCCFYILSNIPRDAQNNPFALYMDQSSVVRGFFATFGIDCEEIAIRFYALFLEPKARRRQAKIDVTRFFDVVQQLCCLVSLFISILPSVSLVIREQRPHQVRLPLLRL